MKIVGISKGFSTNSSSKHSIIINRMLKRDPFDFDFDLENPEFQRNWFVLNTEYAKMLYVASQLYTGFENSVPADELRRAMVQKITGLSKYDLIDIQDHGVDHQSLWNLPTSFPMEFYTDLVTFFKNKDVVVIGGNDEEEIFDYDLSSENGKNIFKNQLLNVTDLHKIKNLIQEFSNIDNKVVAIVKDQNSNQFYPLTQFDFTKDVEIRKDGDYWIAFSYQTGEKIRFTFNLDAKPYTKAKIPELVDLNITEFCNLGCPWCYKAAASTGNHADTNSVLNYIRILDYLGVYEIAIGGGEPTEHPDFAKIISCLESYNQPHTRINFSTYSTKWLDNSDIVQAVKTNVGGIGVSVHSLEDISKIEKIAETVRPDCDGIDRYRNYYKSETPGKPMVMAQHVFGTLPVTETIELLKKSEKDYIPILLLGYKTTGRGENSKEIDYRANPEEYKKLIDVFKKYNGVLSIDTLFVNKYKDLLDSANICELTYTTEEGKFSCYIDAVQNTMSPSSFSELKYTITEGKPNIMGPDSDQILTIFSRF